MKDLIGASGIDVDHARSVLETTDGLNQRLFDQNQRFSDAQAVFKDEPDILALAEEAIAEEQQVTFAALLEMGSSSVKIYASIGSLSVAHAQELDKTQAAANAILKESKDRSEELELLRKKREESERAKFDEILSNIERLAPKAIQPVRLLLNERLKGVASNQEIQALEDEIIRLAARIDKQKKRIEELNAQKPVVEMLEAQSQKPWIVPQALVKVLGHNTAQSVLIDELPIEPILTPRAHERLKALRKRHIGQPEASLYTALYLTEYAGKTVTVDELEDFLYGREASSHSRPRSRVTTTLGPARNHVPNILREEGYVLQYGWRCKLEKNGDNVAKIKYRHRIYRAVALDDLSALEVASSTQDELTDDEFEMTDEIAGLLTKFNSKRNTETQAANVPLSAEGNAALPEISIELSSDELPRVERVLDFLSTNSGAVHINILVDKFFGSHKISKIERERFVAILNAYAEAEHILRAGRAYYKSRPNPSREQESALNTTEVIGVLPPELSQLADTPIAESDETVQPESSPASHLKLTALEQQVLEYAMSILKLRVETLRNTVPLIQSLDLESYAAFKADFPNVRKRIVAYLEQQSVVAHWESGGKTRGVYYVLVIENGQLPPPGELGVAPDVIEALTASEAPPAEEKPEGDLLLERVPEARLSAGQKLEMLSELSLTPNEQACIRRAVDVMSRYSDRQSLRNIIGGTFSKSHLSRAEEDRLVQILSGYAQHGILRQYGQTFGYKTEAERMASASDMNVSAPDREDPISEGDKDMIRFIHGRARNGELNIGEFVRDYFKVQELPPENFRVVITRLNELASLGYLLHAEGSPWYGIPRQKQVEKSATKLLPFITTAPASYELMPTEEPIELQPEQTVSVRRAAPRPQTFAPPTLPPAVRTHRPAQPTVPRFFEREAPSADGDPAGAPRSEPGLTSDAWRIGRYGYLLGYVDELERQAGAVGVKATTLVKVFADKIGASVDEARELVKLFERAGLLRVSPLRHQKGTRLLTAQPVEADTQIDPIRTRETVKAQLSLKNKEVARLGQLKEEFGPQIIRFLSTLAREQTEFRTAIAEALGGAIAMDDINPICQLLKDDGFVVSKMPKDRGTGRSRKGLTWMLTGKGRVFANNLANEGQPTAAQRRSIAKSSHTENQAHFIRDEN